MNPQPRKLALLMSIAGLGPSLVDGVQARTHDVAHTWPIAVEGWPMGAGSAPWPTAPTAPAERQLSLALPSAAIGLLDPGSADEIAMLLRGIQPRAPAPAPRQAVDGLRVRTPSGPRSADRGSEPITAADDPPDAGREANAQVPRRAESKRATELCQADAPLATGRPVRIVAAFAALAPAEPVATRADAAEAEAGFDLAGSFDIDLGYGPAAGAPDATALPLHAGVEADAARVDIAIDFEIDIDLGYWPAPRAPDTTALPLHAGVEADSARVDIEIDIDIDIDIDLRDVLALRTPHTTALPLHAGVDADAARVDIELDIAAGTASQPQAADAGESAVAAAARAPAPQSRHFAAPEAGPAHVADADPPLVLTLRESVGSTPSAGLALDLSGVPDAGVVFDPAVAPFAIVDLGAEPRRAQREVTAALEPAVAAAPHRQDDPAAQRRADTVAATALAGAPLDAPGPAAHTAHTAHTARPGAAAGEWPPSIVVGTQVDRVLHSLEARVGKAGGVDAPADRDSQPDMIFVATQKERVLKTLEAIVGHPARLVPEAALQQPEGTREPAHGGTPARGVGSAPGRTRQLMDDRVALDESRLDNIRGGFQTPGGVMLAFGIERAVYINGSLVTTTNLEVVANAAGTSVAPSITAGVGNLTLIQNGAGNSFITGPVSAATLGMVIQNTLNDQKIEQVLSINATVNSLQLTRAQNFESALRGALVDSLRR